MPSRILIDFLEEESRDIILGGDYKLEIDIKGILNQKLFACQSLDSFTRRSFEIGVIEEALVEKL